jgi:hypothetical protein
MDDKEMIRRVRNSLKAGKSDAQVVRTLQNKGYKLEYIHLILKKVKRRKFLLLFFGAFMLLFLSFLVFVGVMAYSLFFLTSGVKADLSNPLAGLNVHFNDGALGVGNLSDSRNVSIDDIEVGSDFVAYLLNELGAWQLRSNILTGEKPRVNFVIGDKVFGAVVDSGIQMSEEGVESPDLIIHSNKVDIVMAMLSEEPVDIFRESYIEGRSSVDIEASEAELFAKGYLGFYESFQE